LLHRIEPHVLSELPGQEQLYVSWEQQRTLLASILKGSRRIAMQYSPLNAVPYVSRVDAGTIDPDRLQRWRKLIAEDRHNNETLHEARIRSRSFGKTVKAAPSGKGHKR
jgi:hypothetical protein